MCKPIRRGRGRCSIRSAFGEAKRILLLIGFAGTLTCTLLSCHAPTEPSGNSADTTSNDWTFTETMLGGASGSNLYGVDVLNDTLAYAVGDMYLYDSSGQIDPSSYGVATWNGEKWSLRRVYAENQSGYVENIRPIFGITSFSPKDVWFSDGNAYLWNGRDSLLKPYWISGYPGNPSPVLGPSQGVGHFSGTSDRNLYGAGINGGLAWYNGDAWQKLSSGTSLSFQDIYGNDGTVLAVASIPGESLDKAILQINGTTVTQLSTAGIQWPLSSVWFVPGHYYVVGQGIYEKTSLSQSTWQEDSVDTVDFFSCIRGNAWNDFFVAGGYGQLLHFNGKSWRSYQDVLGLQQGGIASIAVKGNLMIGVGYLDSKAVAFVGKRS